MEEASQGLFKIIQQENSASRRNEGIRLLQETITAVSSCLSSEGNLLERRNELRIVLYKIKEFYGQNDPAKSFLFDLCGRAAGYGKKTRQERKLFFQWVRRGHNSEPNPQEKSFQAASQGLRAVQEYYEKIQEEMEMQEEEQQETLDNLQAQADGERRSSRNVSRVDYTEGGSRGQGGQGSRGKGGSSRKKGGKGRGGKKKPASGGQGSTKKKTGRSGV